MNSQSMNSQSMTLFEHNTSEMIESIIPSLSFNWEIQIHNPITLFFVFGPEPK